MGDRTMCEEITDLHTLFQTVFTEGDESGELIANFAARLDPTFWLIDPRGGKHGRQAIVDAVAGRVGSGAVAIEVDECTVVTEEAGLFIGTYIERHKAPEPATERYSTVGMRRDASVPTGWRWLFVHETWIPSPDGTDV